MRLAAEKQQLAEADAIRGLDAHRAADGLAFVGVADQPDRRARPGNPPLASALDW
jgi:hypothetical protein